MADFEEAAKTTQADRHGRGVLVFPEASKKWWLLPIVVIVAFGVLVFLSGTAAAPFIYTLF